MAFATRIAGPLAGSGLDTLAVVMLPFLNIGEGPIPLGDGRLLIRRARSVDVEETQYLVLDHRGGLDGQITLPGQHEILGFGGNHVYVATVGTDDVRRIVRYPCPQAHAHHSVVR